MLIAGKTMAHGGHGDHAIHGWDVIPNLDQVLALFALGLATGRMETDGAPAPIATIVGSLVLGVLLGSYFARHIPALTRAVPLVLAGLLLLDPWGKVRLMAQPIVSVVALAVALVYGTKLPWMASAVTYLGFATLVSAGISVFGLLLWQRFYQAWFRIALRIAGSWLVAIGIMLLGASFRPV